MFGLAEKFGEHFCSDFEPKGVSLCSNGNGYEYKSNPLDQARYLKTYEYRKRGGINPIGLEQKEKK